MFTKCSIKNNQALNETRGRARVHSFSNEGYKASERGDRNLHRTIQMTASWIKK